MSDGMSDATALGELEGAVREAAYHFAKALKRASVGHRGWAMRRGDIVRIVNDSLKDEEAPFVLQESR
jgi:hypothetical protein